MNKQGMGFPPASKGFWSPVSEPPATWSLAGAASSAWLLCCASWNGRTRAIPRPQGRRWPGKRSGCLVLTRRLLSPSAGYEDGMRSDPVAEGDSHNCYSIHDIQFIVLSPVTLSVTVIRLDTLTCCRLGPPQGKWKYRSEPEKTLMNCASPSQIGINFI